MAGEQVTIDIATRVLGATEDIYVIRPGQGFSLYGDFLRKNAVFLDFPDIRLQFGGATPNRQALRQAVVRSMAIHEWHAGGRNSAEPSREPADYVQAAVGRRVGRYVGAIERLYYTMPEGAIIVVPGPGYFSEVLIGVISGPPVEIGDVNEYPGETFPARRVRWIGRRLKAQFPEKLRDRLQKPTPVMALDRSLRSYIMEAAFDQYSIGDTFSARLRTSKADFSILDDYNAQSFLNYVSGVVAILEENPARTKVTMSEALEALSARRDLVPELTSNINSPGALRLFSQKILPLTLAVLFALAISGTPAEAVFSLTNSTVAGDDPCALVVQEQALAAVKMMDLDTWQQVCVQARDAAQSTGMATSIHVIPDRPRP